MQQHIRSKCKHEQQGVQDQVHASLPYHVSHNSFHRHHDI